MLFEHLQPDKSDQARSAFEEADLASTALMTANALLYAIQKSLQSPAIGQMDDRHVASVLLALEQMEQQSVQTIGTLEHIRNLAKKREAQAHEQQ